MKKNLSSLAWMLTHKEKESHCLLPQLVWTI